jgi:hypothetical protein
VPTTDASARRHFFDDIRFFDPIHIRSSPVPTIHVVTAPVVFAGKNAFVRSW